MVLEAALIEVVPGREDEFAAAYRRGRPILAGTPGCRSVRMTRGIESASRFVLLVEWDDVTAHEKNFRGTDRLRGGGSTSVRSSPRRRGWSTSATSRRSDLRRGDQRR
jgi:heme-degrading monooxygenase HmoA